MRIWSEKDNLRCVDCGTQDKQVYENRCFPCGSKHNAETRATACEGWTELIETRTRGDSK